MWKLTYLLLIPLLIFYLDCKNPKTTQVEHEEVVAINPNLPPVPHIPPPKHPIQYDDGTYSIRGLRNRMDEIIGNEVRVKGYIAKIYQPPECPEGRTCPPPRMPHLWLADEPQETNPKKLLRVVGYAQNQKEIDEAREAALKGKKPPELEPGRPPIVWDWQLGHQYIITGKFVYRSGSGFADMYGLLEYKEHKCLDCPELETEKDKK